ncbi:MAG: alkane 1-monooxygenase [Pseudomonadota bacterium]
MQIRWLGHLLPLALPCAVLAGHALGGAWNFLTLVLLFVLLPLADLALGVDRAPLAPRGSAGPAARLWFDALLYAWVPIQLALLAWGAHAVAAATDPVAALGVTLSIGAVTGGIGITVAHELGHRLGRVPRSCAGLLLATVAYGHFLIEHNKGHHARVATPEDPASARYGESFFAFLPRTLVGGFVDAWRLESERLARQGRTPWHASNRMLWVVAAPLAISLALGATLGAVAVAFWWLQATYAVLLLELVNYVEHYGLARARGPDGRWERVRHAHSWNSSHRVGNWLLFNLQRHSQHHANVTRRYEELEHADDAPQLPASYASMVLLALVPPLWRRVVHPRLAAWRPGQSPS